MCSREEKGGERMPPRKHFINDRHAEKCRSYVYRGEDRSILYNMFLSDFAETMLKFVPRTVSPNTLTLLGLTHTVISYGLLFNFCPEFSCDQAPNWVLPVCGICFFAYQTFDNMDGKQARRTKSSTSLGLVFDHGCDSINIIFGSVFICTLINAGTAFWVIFLTFANTAIPFYTATLEHYYVGKLVLKTINGPCEGVLSGVLSAISVYWLGTSFFWENGIYIFGKRVPLAVVLLATMTFVNILSSLHQIYTILASEHKAKRSMLQPLRDMSSFGFVISMMLVWGFLSPQLFESHPHAVLWLFGALTTEILLLLMLGHVCGTRYAPWRPVLAPLPFAVANRLLFVTPPIDEQLMLCSYTIAAVAMVAWNLYTIVYELSEALGIWVFSLKPRKMQ